MIIGYDFWADGVFYDASSTPIIIEDNDGVAFDNCNSLCTINSFTLKGGHFDELNITKDNKEIDNNAQKADGWGNNNVLLAKFENDLIGGTIGVDGYNIAKIELKKRKKGEEFWQTYYSIPYDENINFYTIIDKFIESEETYEYCLCPVAIIKDEDKETRIYGSNTISQEVFVSYNYACLFDNSASYMLIYDLKIGDMSKQIGANLIETLSSPYPYVVYGQNDYIRGNISCLLVSEESTTGAIDIKSEKQLRNNILNFLSNKNCKVFKNCDGTYMLIQIIGNPTLTPLNDVLGVYQINFEYVQMGNVNDADELSSLKLQFEYQTIQETENETITKTFTGTVGR